VATLAPPAPPVAAAPRVAAPLAAPAAASAIVTTELPLFVRDLVSDRDDEDEQVPMVKVPPRPRQPLGVRRATPDPAKLRAKYPPRAPEADLPGLLDAADQPAVVPTAMWPQAEPDAAPSREPALLGLRLAAAAIDASVLGAVAAVTVAFTLRVVELPLNQALALPVIPMLAFFALVSLGYELMFTAANGQTIGKMLMGLRVVSDETDAPGDRVPLRQAALRAVSMLPLGAGLVAALAGGLAVHDRVAHTRVVRA